MEHVLSSNSDTATDESAEIVSSPSTIAATKRAARNAKRAARRQRGKTVAEFTAAHDAKIELLASEHAAATADLPSNKIDEPISDDVRPDYESANVLREYVDSLPAAGIDAISTDIDITSPETISATVAEHRAKIASFDADHAAHVAYLASHPDTVPPAPLSAVLSVLTEIGVSTNLSPKIIAKPQTTGRIYHVRDAAGNIVRAADTTYYDSGKIAYVTGEPIRHQFKYAASDGTIIVQRHKREFSAAGVEFLRPKFAVTPDRLLFVR